MEKNNKKLVIFCGPSGTGKSTLANFVAPLLPLGFSVSATTREKRSGETDGVQYYFIAKEEFKKKIAEDAFVEYEEFYNQYYGTLKSELERIWSAGKSAMFDVDVLGAINLKKKFGDRALTIFISPPSKEVLFERLEKRATSNPEDLKLRKDRAEKELAKASEFDHIVINDDLEKAKSEALEIVKKFLS